MSKEKEVKYNSKCKYCGLGGLAWFPDKNPHMRFPNGDGHEYDPECKEIQRAEDRESKYQEVYARHMRAPEQVSKSAATTPAAGQTTLNQDVLEKINVNLGRMADAIEIIAKIESEKSIHTAKEELEQNIQEA